MVIEQVASREWGIGGNARTTADVKAVAAGAPVGRHRVGPAGLARPAGLA